MHLSSIMTPAPRTVRPDTSTAEALALMDLLRVRHLPVLREDGALAGVVSDRDLLSATGWVPDPRTEEDPRRRPATVERVMSRDVRTLGPEDSVIDAAVGLLGHGIGCLPVLDQGRLVGIVTEVDVLEAYLRGADRSADATEIRQLMTGQPVTCAPDATLAGARKVMRSADVRHLPVVERGALVGILSDRDLRRAHGAGRSKDTPVEDLMTRDVVTLPLEAPAADAARAITRNGISAVPIVASRERPRDLCGIATVADLIEHALSFLRSDERMRAG